MPVLTLLLPVHNPDYSSKLRSLHSYIFSDHSLFRFVKVLMVLLFIIAWPIAKLLDCMLGVENSTFFRRAGNDFILNTQFVFSLSGN